MSSEFFVTGALSQISVLGPPSPSSQRLPRCGQDWRPKDVGSALPVSRCPSFVSAPRWLQAAKSTCLNPDRVTAQLPTHYTQQGVSSDGLPQFPCPARSPLLPSLQPALTPSPDASLDLTASPTVFTWLPPPPHPFQTPSPTLQEERLKNKRLSDK